MKTYKAEFANIRNVLVFIELFGEYLDCYETAVELSKVLNMTFTGILEEIKNN